ncbi:hypothetical protein LUZ61_011521 [Rhynchospora tenuis]|uniref:RING-CH-type domain-containing protein n=1 Tax=Rhynchospora tenuis TaxID=198213 RepID=A0AAD6F0B5_9POAL|nr:hypothetical protein LUZ61_011521 [Rhynchospora tenuis]
MAMASRATSDQTNPSATSGASPPQVQSLTTIHSGAEVDDEEEEDQCRICRCEATVKDPLRYPCACRGSMKFVHQDCLLQWLKHSSSHRCEVCGHTFSFTQRYDEKAPARLSFVEQLSWVAAKASPRLLFLTRVATVLFVWLLMVPLITAQVCNMVFIRSFGELGEFRWLLDYRTIFYETVRGQGPFYSIMLLGAAFLLYLEMLGENRIRLVHRGPNDELQFEGFHFHEILGIRGPVINLVKRVFRLQLDIALDIAIGFFIPFSWGRIILNQMGATKHGLTGHVGDWTTLAVGYLSIGIPGVIVVGLYKIIRFSKDTSPSRSIIVKALSARMSFVLRLIKQLCVIMIVLGAFPWVCGWWLQTCTVKMVQVQFGDLDLTLLLFFRPLKMLAWWACGILSVMVIRKFLLMISEEVQQGLLDFLHIPADINRNWIREFTAAPLHVNACRVLLHTGVFMISMVVLVYLPFRLIMHIVPSFFPLNFIIFYSIYELYWNTLWKLLCSRYVSCRFNPHSAFKFLLHYWLSFVSGILGLDDFLLPMNKDANGSASNNSRFEVVLKFAALLILGIVSLVLLIAMIVVPISLGRAAFSFILWIPTFSSMGTNDGINFLVGCYIISEGSKVVRSFIILVGTRRLLSVVQLAGKWCIIGLKSFALLSISVLVIPLLAGLLFNLTIEMPLDVRMQKRMDERPLYYFNYIWVLGFGPLGEWIRLVMLIEEGEGDWHAKLTRVKADGFSHLRALWVLREILYPFVSFLLNWLCIPCVFAKGVFPLLGYSKRANSIVYHFAWLGYPVLLVLWLFAKEIRIWLSGLHDRIKDDRYLIGRTLHNYQEDSY